LAPVDADWFYSVLNTTPQPISFNIQLVTTITNGFSNFSEVYSNLDAMLGPYYRFESGTSMAAANASGVLALMQEFFQRQNRTNSPAMMKALLINGARSAGRGYNLQVGAPLNLQGWGLINLPTAIPGMLTNQTAVSNSMFMVDQSPTNSLATCEKHIYKLTVN